MESITRAKKFFFPPSMDFPLPGDHRHRNKYWKRWITARDRAWIINLTLFHGVLRDHCHHPAEVLRSPPTPVGQRETD